MIKHSRHVLVGFAGGIAVAAILPFLAPVMGEATRPVAKLLLKQTLLAIDRLRTLLAKSSESIEDLIAEVRSEVDAELEAKAPSRREIASPAEPDANTPAQPSGREALS